MTGGYDATLPPFCSDKQSSDRTSAAVAAILMEIIKCSIARGEIIGQLGLIVILQVSGRDEMSPVLLFMRDFNRVEACLLLRLNARQMLSVVTSYLINICHQSWGVRVS